MYHLLPTLFEQLSDCAPISLTSSSRANGVTMGETEASIFVELPLAGCSKENIQINFDKGILTVTGETAESKEEIQYFLKASRDYTFQVSIPRRIDEQIAPEATYKDGILRVEFQKQKADRMGKIEIKTA